MTKYRLFFSFILCWGLIQQSNATNFNYNLTFDGPDISGDAGAATPAGSVLSDGDNFNLNIHASGSDYWRVDNDFSNVFIPLSFHVDPPGIRTGNVVSKFWQDGIQVEQIDETDVSQQILHLGANIWTLSTGLEFDTITMSYELLTSTTEPPNPTGIDTTIRNTTDILLNFPNSTSNLFFRHDSISYVSAVPVPAAVWLFGSGLIGLLGVRKKSSTISTVSI
jgi:hypothetical protein